MDTITSFYSNRTDDVLTEKVRKDAPEPIIFVYDIILCRGNEVDTTEYLYLEIKRKTLERGSSWVN